MHKSQARRSVIAARLGPNTGATPSTGRPGTDLTARVQTPVKPTGYHSRKHRAGGPRGQRRDSTGGTAGAWNRSAAGEMRRTGDRRWDMTASTMGGL